MLAALSNLRQEWLLLPKGNLADFFKNILSTKSCLFQTCLYFHAILASGTDTIVFCWRQTILCLVVMRILLYFSYISWVRNLGRAQLGDLFFHVVAARVLSGFSWQMDWSCMWEVRIPLLPCLVPCWGWLEGRLNWHLFLSMKSQASPCGLCSRVRLLSWWFKTLRESVPRNPRKLWGIWRANLRRPWVSLLPHSVVRQVTGPVRVKKRNETSFSMEASFNWPQMFSNHMAFHMGLGIGSLSLQRL